MLGVLLTILTTCYVTYVVTLSDFPPVTLGRGWIFDRTRDGSWVRYLVTCGWCAGFWIAIAVTAVVALTVGLPLPGLVAPSAAATTGILLEAVETLWARRGDNS